MTDLRDKLQETLGNRYTIERELGGGGMSHVFLAEENALNRRVVIKVLLPELSGYVSTERFRREISLAARLQHPHIVPLLSAGELDGLPYYTMPFVDGESLGTRLASGELPIPETIHILRDVARALEYAHAQGVAHRDIKPDNVLLVGTSAVITDFGVAKAISEATNTGSLTSIGVALGTAAYMAPEQAAADPGTDLRADIYAFGATAYEMLAGHTPFAGRTPQSMLAAHAIETPRPIDALRPAIPRALADLVMQCLQKNPADRPQTASALVHALDSIPLTNERSSSEAARLPLRLSHIQRGRAIAIVSALLLFGAASLWWARRSMSPEGEIQSIAVLPFENSSKDAEFDYLEDGITDHVRDALNAIPGLTVKARSSSRQMKGRDARDIGAALEVGAVLQGAVSRSSDRLHVTAELVRTADDNVLWSGTFDGERSELAGIQDTVVRAIVHKLNLEPAKVGEGSTRAGRGTTNIEAYDLFLRGRYASDRLDFGRAIELFSEATRLDPRFARAYAYLAMSYANSPTLGTTSVDSLNRLARINVDRALAIDSGVAEAYVAESYFLGNEGRLADMIPPFEKAVKLDSTNVDILAPYAITLAQVGRVSEGLAVARRARDIDPLSSQALGILAYLTELTGNIEGAITQNKAALDVDPKNVLLNQGLGFEYAFAGKPDSSVAAFEAAFRIDSTLWGRRSNLVFGYAVAGRWDDADRQRALIERDPPGNSPDWHRMIVALAYGEYDNAMRALERGWAERQPLFYITSIPCDPIFDPLKNDQRFNALMQKLKVRTCTPFARWPIRGRQP
jgi:serine/threonine-protein kinase